MDRSREVRGGWKGEWEEGVFIIFVLDFYLHVLDSRWLY